MVFSVSLTLFELRFISKLGKLLIIFESDRIQPNGYFGRVYEKLFDSNSALIVNMLPNCAFPCWNVVSCDSNLIISRNAAETECIIWWE